jgi:GNAT superfamily N-acetyltransferase
LLALDADDRYARFGSAIRDAGISTYVGRLDFERDLLLGVEFAGNLIGLAHVGCGVGELAELALSVTPRWRYRGVARTLFKGAAERAAGCGIAGFACIHGHPATLRIASTLGLLLSIQTADPRVIIRMQPTWPSFWELASRL